MNVAHEIWFKLLCNKHALTHQCERDIRAFVQDLSEEVFTRGQTNVLEAIDSINGSDEPGAGELGGAVPSPVPS